MSCDICGYKEVTKEQHEKIPGVFITNCARCGTYQISQGAIEAITSIDSHRRFLLSGVTRHFSEQSGKHFLIQEKVLRDPLLFDEQITALIPNGINKKTDVILKYLAEKSKNPGSLVKIVKELDYPIGYCADKPEFEYYLSHLYQLGLISGDIDTPKPQVSISVKGWEHLEALRHCHAESRQAFVAMWFDEKMTKVYAESIRPLEETTGFRMIRTDMVEFNEDINDKIMAEIRRSRFLIADMTGHSRGVYFEAGFAMGLGLPVIWTCMKGELEKAHFDTRQFNHIVWTDAADLKERLQNRILATIGTAY